MASVDMSIDFEMYVCKGKQINFQTYPLEYFTEQQIAPLWYCKYF